MKLRLVAKVFDPPKCRPESRRRSPWRAWENPSNSRQWRRSWFRSGRATSRDRALPWTAGGSRRCSRNCRSRLSGDCLVLVGRGQQPAAGGVRVGVVERVAGAVGRDDQLEVGAGAVVGNRDGDDVALLAPEEGDGDAVTLAAVELKRDLRDVERELHRGLLVI